MNALPTIYQFKVQSLRGDTIDFSDFKGKKILVVNTASKCGFTPQYEQLQRLFEERGDHLVIVGFPANDFGGQEPGTNQEIGEFCNGVYGVTFPMAAKSSVKGEDITPVFKWLTRQEENGVMDVNIKWNFTKFLINEQGELEASFESHITPLSGQIMDRL